jgi:hypothetical protein
MKLPHVTARETEEIGERGALDISTRTEEMPFDRWYQRDMFFLVIKQEQIDTAATFARQ